MDKDIEQSDMKYLNLAINSLRHKSKYISESAPKYMTFLMIGKTENARKDLKDKRISENDQAIIKRIQKNVNQKKLKNSSNHK